MRNKKNEEEKNKNWPFWSHLQNVNRLTAKLQGGEKYAEKLRKYLEEINRSASCNDEIKGIKAHW